MLHILDVSLVNIASFHHRSYIKVLYFILIESLPALSPYSSAGGEHRQEAGRREAITIPLNQYYKIPEIGSPCINNLKFGENTLT